MMFPWLLICITHPFGHDHHQHENPSPCELRKEYSGNGPVFFPPMNCDQVSSKFEDYEKIANNNSTHFSFAIATLPFSINSVFKKVFLQSIEVRSNSDPPFITLKDRAPPDNNSKTNILLTSRRKIFIA